MIRDIFIGLLSVAIFISIILLLGNNVYGFAIVPFIFLFLYFVIKKKDLLEKAGSFIYANIKIFLIGLFALSFLFIFFLYSGGIYTYINMNGTFIRANKITNSVQFVKSGIWKDMGKKQD